MNVIIAGGSGFLGSALQQRLRTEEHAVGILTRRPRAGVQQDIGWTPDGSSGPWAHALEGADVIINLAGAGIADQRWSESRKQLLRESRVLATRSLANAIRSLQRPPQLVISGSAVGYYGPRGDVIVTEATPAGSDFLSRLAEEWEHEADPIAAVTRLAWIRTGIVLHPSGGALAQMLLPFKLGVGGRLGPGTQYFPWIHRDDWVELVVWMATGSRTDGPFNATAPHPVTNAEFTQTLARTLHRPAFVPMPTVVLRLLLGELAETLVTGQRAIPGRAMENGFTFRYPDLGPALRALLN